ncbi:MAG: hypothetical protein IPM81_16630 [Saprospirales bacterium]|nr:hypothetical protein [Saprospirales bacterium]
MQNKWLLVCWAGIHAAAGIAQNALSTADVLASARRDMAVILQAEQMDYARQTAPRLPFVEQVGLRTETDRFDWQRQEFLARLNVNGLKEMRRQGQYQQSVQQLAGLQYQGLLHEALAKRYAALIQYRYLQRQIAVSNRLLLVYQDEINVLQKRAALNAGVDIAAILKAEYERDELALQLSGASDRLQQLRKAIQLQAQLPSDQWELDTTGFVRPDQIIGIASSLPDVPENNPGLAGQAAKIARQEAAYLLEKAQAQQVLDFVQLRHNNRPDDPFGQNLSIGLGINLPFKGTSSYKLAVLKIEKSAAVAELELERVARNLDLDDARAGITASGCSIPPWPWNRWKTARRSSP